MTNLDKQTSRFCYIKVTNDEFELPLAIADSVEVLAKECNTTKKTIYTSVCRSKKGKRNKDGTKRYYPYRKVEIPNDES